MSPCSETLSENGINQEETETREGEREKPNPLELSREVMPGVSSISGFLSCMNQSIPPCARASMLGFLPLRTRRILMASRSSGHVSLMATAYLFLLSFS